ALVAAELREARFLWLGDGSLRSALEARARALGLAAKVVFTGMVPPFEVAKYVGLMDCLLHLSGREAVSRGLPQALAARRPVVAYDFDGADEVCVDGKTGFLIKIGEFRSAAKAVLKLARDPTL